ILSWMKFETDFQGALKHAQLCRLFGLSFPEAEYVQAGNMPLQDLSFEVINQAEKKGNGELLSAVQNIRQLYHLLGRPVDPQVEAALSDSSLLRSEMRV